MVVAAALTHYQWVGDPSSCQEPTLAISISEAFAFTAVLPTVPPQGTLICYAWMAL